MATDTKTFVDACRTEILEHIAFNLNQSGIRYAVAHGLDGYPDNIGRDLDLCVGRSERDAAIHSIVSEFKKNGWIPVIYRSPWAEWIVSYKDSAHGILGVEVDLLSKMQWGWATLLNGTQYPYTNEKYGPFVVDRWVGFVKRVFLQVVAGNLGRFSSGKKHEFELVIYDYEREVVAQKLAQLLGVEMAPTLINAIDRRDLDFISNQLLSLRRHLLFRALVHPRLLVSSIFSWFRNEWAETVMPQSNTPVVRMCGADNARIKEVAELVAARLRERFVFTSIEVQGFEQNCKINVFWKRRVRSSRLGLTLVVCSGNMKGARSSFDWISPFSLSLEIKAKDADSLTYYESAIVNNFAEINNNAGQV